MSNMLVALLQIDDTTGGGAGGIVAILFGGVFLVIWLIVMVAVAAGAWKVFEKAGEPGWSALVPFYNAFVFARIAGREPLWGALLLIPCVNFITLPMVCIDVARKFGKDTIYGIGLAFLGIIFFPMLGFGSAQYNRNA
jgi:hypothetical protein